VCVCSLAKSELESNPSTTHIKTQMSFLFIKSGFTQRKLYMPERERKRDGLTSSAISVTKSIIFVSSDNKQDLNYEIVNWEFCGQTPG